MALTLDDLFGSPDHYLHSFEDDTAVFLPMDRAAYHRSIFLDGRIDAARPGAMRVRVAMLADPRRPPASIGWIFHIAHCGSTLLARALDLPAANLILREPLALRQVALTPSTDRLALVTAMLGKRYRPDLPTIVKANVPVNFLLPELVTADPVAPAIFLYMPLRDYLLAILRSDNHREWLRRVTTQLARHLGPVEHLRDAERAALLWLRQMKDFAAAMARMTRARSLDAELFFAEPRAVLEAAAAHLQVPLSSEEIAERVAGPLFGTYSKNPAVAFDNAARLARRHDLEEALAEEIAVASRWIDGVVSADPLAALKSAALISI